MSSPVVERWTHPDIAIGSDVTHWHRAAQTPKWAERYINKGEGKQPSVGDTLALHQDGTVTVERATIDRKEPST